MIAHIYTKPSCKQCDKAKALLRANGYRYSEIDITNDNYDDSISYLEKLAHKKITDFPQILFESRYIGDCSSLEKLLPKK